MTDKQRRFADEYLIDLNATRAYKVAYPSVKSDDAARVNASRLLAKANIQEYVQERKADRQERTQIRQDDVLRQIQEMATGAESETVRLRALELLGKHLGLFDPRKDQLDQQEQAARIAKLRAETRTEDERRELVVRFEDFPDEAEVTLD